MYLFSIIYVLKYTFFM